MSQYAYIPYSQVAQLQQEYTVSPSTWTFEKSGVEYGGLEHPIFTQAQIDEIENLGGDYFANAVEFGNWLNDATDPLSVVKRDRKFGQDILNEYLAQNKALTLTVQQSVEQLTKFATVKQLLETGAIMVSLGLVSQIVVDDVFTQERKDYFINKLSAYLGL